jgi:tetratricopeptide (TPR) repeat protein
MNVSPPAACQQSLEQFRHLLFHLQTECGSIHHLVQYLEREQKIEKFNELKRTYPYLMSQLLAREYVLEAQKSPDKAEAIKYLETALSLDAHCQEACLELANLSETAESAMKWFQKCMDVAIAALGMERMAELLEAFKINPWRQVELHHYMKAKVSLAERLYRSGYYETSILHFQEIISFNPSDELGIRFYLFAALIIENRLEEASTLLAKYPDEWSAKWYFLRAFLRFKEEGDTRRSRRALERAFRRNLWVPIYLLGLDELPPVHLMNKKNPSQYRIGSRREGADCVKCIGPAFCENPKLIYWVWEILKMKVSEEIEH